MTHRASRAKRWCLILAGVSTLASPFVSALVHPAQVLAQSPAFDAASIKPSKPPVGGGRSGPEGGRVRIAPPGRVFATGVTARRIIQEAYHLTEHQLSGGPRWLDSDWFVLEAKAESQANSNQLRLMLQTLLAERFKLVVHRETKEMPVYALMVGKNGPKLPEGKEGESILQKVSPGTERSTTQMVMFSRSPVQDFAYLLSLDPSIGRPVLDKTGLQGVYTFSLTWDADENIMTAVQEQFGLKFESQKAPIDILVIDSIEKPEAN